MGCNGLHWGFTSACKISLIWSWGHYSRTDGGETPNEERLPSEDHVEDDQFPEEQAQIMDQEDIQPEKNMDQQDVQPE